MYLTDGKIFFWVFQMKLKLEVLKCFKNSRLPSLWLKSIINPIPKSQKDDPRVPLNYRGISLMSTVYKLYSTLLNDRLTTFLEKEKEKKKTYWLSNRMGSIREESVLIIFTVCTIVRNRLQENMPNLLH